jgi:hypothetical protein
MFGRDVGMMMIELHNEDVGEGGKANLDLAGEWSWKEIGMENKEIGVSQEILVRVGHGVEDEARLSLLKRCWV